MTWDRNNIYNFLQTVNILFRGKDPFTLKIIINGATLEPISHFHYLGYDITYSNSSDIDVKLAKSNSICCAIRRIVVENKKGDPIKVL